MKVIEYLKTNGLDSLVNEFGITVAQHPSEPLTILNYGISSPRNEVCNECRGLVLETGTWNLVARAFTRFFNYGEMPESYKNFNWDNYTVQAKEDGSLILVYFYNGWKINTRGSFGHQKIVEGCDYSWRDLVLEQLNTEELNKDYTYIFELCSPYNKIVRTYKNPQLFHLTTFYKKDELGYIPISVPPVKTYSIKTIEEAKNFLSSQEPTFEGFIYKDDSNIRFKLKSSQYVLLHHLKGNNNIFLPKYLIPLILDKNTDKQEILATFPELEDKWNKYELLLDGHYQILVGLWEKYGKIESQKEFAQSILTKTPFCAILFEARKKKLSIKEIWDSYTELVAKITLDLKCLQN